MLKLFGAAVVMCGSLGMVYQWFRQRKLRQRRLKELLDFFAAGSDAMEMRKLRLETFFRNYRTEDPVFKKAAAELAEAIRSCAYPSGELLWKAVWSRHKNELGFKREEWELLLESGNVFFGAHLQENLRQGKLVRKRLEEFLEREMHDFREKEKIAAPLGMLCGLLLILVLI